MSGILGWIGAKVTHGDLVDLAQKMSDRIVEMAVCETEARLTQEWAVSVKAPSEKRHFAQSGPITAVLDGSPRWNNPGLIDIAKHSGHGAALIEAYRRNGPEVCSLVGGSFAFAVFDEEKTEGLIAIDRWGVRPLCFAEPREGALVFGTSAEAVRLHPLVHTSVDPQAIFDYFFFTRVPAPVTIYREVRKLLPGQLIHYKGGKVAVHQYWTVSYPAADNENPSALAQELTEALSNSVRRCIDEAGGGSVGAFLSGGIDSSAIIGLSSRITSGNVTAFSIGFDVPEYNELIYARAAARHFGVELHEYLLTPQDLAAFIPALVKIYDEPYGNTSCVAAYYCANFARSHGIEFMLAGDGGDELFAGNTRYARQYVFDLYQRLPHWLRRGILEPLFVDRRSLSSVPYLRKIGNYIQRSSIDLPDRLESYNYFFKKPPSEFFIDDVAGQIDPDHPLEICREQYFASNAQSSLNRMLDLDLRITLADDDLRKIERTAEYAGIRVGYPFLNDEVLAISTRIPAHLKLDRWHLRHFFKEAFKDFLPPSALEKQKHGFGVPFGYWLKSNRLLKDLAFDTLSDLKERKLFQPHFLDNVIRLHGEGHGAYYGEIVWLLMILELWLREHVDG